MISQFTDDDLGTGIGTNLATNHFRLDYALRRGLVFQISSSGRRFDVLQILRNRSSSRSDATRRRPGAIRGS
jgi:hypothetical protein